MLVATKCFDYEGKHCHHDKEVPPDMFQPYQLEVLIGRGWIIDTNPKPVETKKSKSKSKSKKPVEAEAEALVFDEEVDEES